MSRVRRALRALVRRALRQHGDETPVLTGVVLNTDREAGELWPSRRIADSRRSWVPTERSDEWSGWEPPSADVRALRRAVRRDAYAYPELIGEHNLDPRRRRRSRISEQIERLAQNLRPRRESALFFAVGRRLFEDEGSAEAQERGLRLLKDSLSPAQLEQYERYRYFEVIGGRTGRRYRIRHGRMMNIDQLDGRGRHICGWCFFPEGHLVAGDVMLAQKLALELFEPEALEIANRF